MDTLDLASPDLLVSIDPDRGADVLSLVDRRTEVDVLFKSPWRERAEAIRAGQTPSTFDPFAGWLESYRGGWQTLCPNAGDPRSVHAAPVSFHGEASVVPWIVDEISTSSARLHVDLFSIPIRIDRSIEIRGPQLRILDSIANLSDVALEFDYSHHPAFGGAFLDGTCRIETGATRFTSDPATAATLEPGSVHDWPTALSHSGDPIDLRDIPAPGTARVVFGWLDRFSDCWASLINVELGLTVRLEWDGEYLPYAWLWQELNASDGFPWYRRARVVAIEPASVQTSGPGRSALRLGPRVSAKIPIRVILEGGS